MMVMKLFRSRALVTMLEKSADCRSKYTQRLKSQQYGEQLKSLDIEKPIEPLYNFLNAR